jgi:RNA methyltransferase, TrmH family
MTEPAISSTANPRIKVATRLRERSARDASGLTLVDGAREISRALASGIEVVELFACFEQAGSEDARSALALAAAAGIAPVTVSSGVLARLAYGHRSDGVVAIARVPPTDLERLSLPADPFVVVVESIEKPGNLGAILRSADGAGVDALIAADPLADVFSPNAIRASLGTIFAVPIALATTTATLAWLRSRDIAPIVARVDGAVSYQEADLTGPIAIVLGNEARGLADPWSEPAITAVRLPMLGLADSLNVSAAAAILLYEARRQRGD